MKFRKVGMVLAAAVLAVVLAMGAWASHGATRTVSAGGDPMTVFQTFIDAVNANDSAGSAAFFADDGSFQVIDGGSFGVFGRAAIGFAFQDLSQEDNVITLTNTQVSGTVVTGVASILDNDARAAGIERYLQPFTAEIVNGKIQSLAFTYDETDAQTQTYLAYVANQEDEGPEPEASVEVRMTGDQGGGDSGAFVGDLGNGVVGVFVGIVPLGFLEPGAEGVWQPSGIHEGTCDSLGDLAQRLAVVVDGGAGSLISGDYDHLLDEPHAIAVAASADDLTIVACGNIEAPAAAPTEAPPTATPRVVLPNTGSGGGTTSLSGWLIVALVAAGAAGIAGFGALRLRARRRS